MKYLAIAIIAVGTLAYDLGAWVWLSEKEAHSADVTGVFILMFCLVAWVFAHIADSEIMKKL